MSDTFGHDPIQRPIVLSTAAAFVHQIQPRTTPFPAGIEARIELWDSTWATLLDTWDATTVTTSLIEWAIEPSSTGAIPEHSRYRLYLTYPTAPALPYLWATGAVIRK
ncbi:LtfC-like domain-containing protein [Nocardia thailandica]|uniref:LtfC/p132/Gp6 beta-sandwich domain-containing protein n=1 Tax=Nocardia thailandica TaxID=257275 RepID=A0ABW6PX02_9NOCA|nr:hypothetical protein [Nocardia thailandica]